MKKAAVRSCGHNCAGYVGGRFGTGPELRLLIIRRHRWLPVFSWTGCYIGADVGGGFINDRDSERTAAGAPSPFSPTSSANPSGVTAGGVLGV